LTMPDEPPYRVLWSRPAIDAVKEFGRKAREAGGGKDFARIVRTLDERLTEPLAVGEVYRTKGAVEERLAVQEFLAIDFAVDRERKLVLVRHCRALSGHGL
jgi:hypothetical protein